MSTKESKSDSLMDSHFADTYDRIQSYIEMHNINEIISDLLNSLFHELPSDPVSFMVKYLINIRPIDVMENQGMIITTRLKTTLPKSVCGVAFPFFDKKCSNLFKSVLTPAVFHKIKDLKTQPFLHTVRPIFQIATENQNQKTGLFAIDHDCYYTYDAIFSPVLKILNYGLEEKGSYTYKRFFESLDRNDELSPHYCTLISDFRVKVRRNISGASFNSVLGEEKRGEISNKLLFSLLNTHGFNSSYNLAYLDEESKRNLCNSIQSITNEKKNLTRSGARFKDWPKSRVVARSADLKTLVWINKEDHLEIYYLSERINTLKEALYNPLDLAQKLDRRFNFAFDEKFGFFTAKPSYLGLGIKISLKIRLSPPQLFYFKINLPALYEKCPHFDVRELVPDGSWWELILRRRAWLSMCELFEKIHAALEILFDGITLKSEKEEIFEAGRDTEIITQENLPSEDCPIDKQYMESLVVARGGEAKMSHAEEEEEEEYGKAEKIAVAAQSQDVLTNFGTSWRACVRQGLVLDPHAYEIFSDEIAKQFKIEALASRGGEHPFDLKQLLNEKEGPNFLMGNHGIVKSAYFILRRNLRNVVFKPLLTEDSIKQQTEIFMRIKDKLEQTKFIEGKVLKRGDSEFHSTIKTICDRLNLYNNSDEYRKMSSVESVINQTECPWGSAYYRTNDDKIIVLLDFQDHITFGIKITSFELSDSLDKVIELDQFFKENFTDSDWAFERKFGYLTLDPLYSGYGLSLNVVIDINREKFNLMNCFTALVGEAWKITENETGSLIFCLENVESPEKFALFRKQINLLINEIKLQKMNEYVNLTGGISFASPGLEKNYLDNKSVNTDISILDCFSDNDLSLLAFDSSCFEHFAEIYKDYLQMVNVNEEKIRTAKAFDLSNEKNLDHVAKEIDEFRFKFEIGRNFEGYKFKLLMTAKAKMDLVQKILAFSQTYFGDIEVLKESTDSRIKKALYPADIVKNLSHVDGGVVILPKKEPGLAIWCLFEDHIRIVGNSDVSNHSLLLYVAFDFLHELEREKKLTPYYHEGFGFLAERAKYLGSNFRYEIKFKSNVKLIEDIKEKIHDERVIISTKSIQEGEGILLGIKIRSNKVALLNEHIALINKILNPV